MNERSAKAASPLAGIESNAALIGALRMTYSDTSARSTNSKFGKSRLKIDRHI